MIKSKLKYCLQLTNYRSNKSQLSQNWTWDQNLLKLEWHDSIHCTVLTRLQAPDHWKLVRKAYKLCVSKCKHSHWSTGCEMQLLLADKSKKNLWAFLSAITCPWLLSLCLSKNSLKCCSTRWNLTGKVIPGNFLNFEQNCSIAYW